MSRATIWQFNDFFQLRKKKLVNLLISEIIFLRTKFERIKNKEGMHYLKNSLSKLEYLLNKLQKYSSEIPEEDFDKIIMMIYRIFKEIADNLEQEVRI
ncbi:MAG: hypothetical protein ACFFDN_49760 [Candidatus Hodarchaeota archaeon]